MPNLKVVNNKSAAVTFNGWSDAEPESVLREWEGPLKPILFGLPCSGCRAYYDAELKACPICGCAERVSPTACAVIVHPHIRAA